MKNMMPILTISGRGYWEGGGGGGGLVQIGEGQVQT